MKSYAFLQYAFIFDPAEGWSHAYQFEKDMADFFAAHGFDAELMKQVEGSSGTKVIILKKIDSGVIPTPEANRPGRPITIPGKFNKIRETKQSAPARDFKMGKFLPRKGYLKK
jgi:hypothetical protein